MSEPSLLLLLPLVCACQKAPPQAVHVLGATGLEVRAHGPVAMVTREQEVTLTLRPGARTPTRLSVSAASPGETQRETPGETPSAPPGATGLPLAAPLQGSYSLTRYEGGSGGAEAALRGQIRSPTQRWTFACHAQSESEPPEAECLSLLATLRPAAAP